MRLTTFLLKFANATEEIPLKELKQPIRLASLHIYSALILSQTKNLSLLPLASNCAAGEGELKERR
jgi:hypothetical protein